MEKVNRRGRKRSIIGKMDTAKCKRRKKIKAQEEAESKEWAVPTIVVEDFRAVTVGTKLSLNYLCHGVN